MNKKFFLGLVKEGIGYESGFIRTLIDLLKNPKMVVEASVNNDLKYVNPVKFLVTICSYFVLVNSFFIDWDTVSLNHVKEIKYLTSGTKQLNELDIFEANFLATIFSTGIIPLLMTFVIIQLFLISRKENLNPIQFEYHKDVLFYYNGINVLLTFVFSIIAALLSTKLFILFIILYSVLYFAGYRKVMELKPISNYFNEEQNDIVQLHNKTQKKTTFYLGLIVGIFLLAYVTFTN